jgi:hypothetical protein
MKVHDLWRDKDQVVFSTAGDKLFREWSSEVMHEISIGTGPISLSVQNQTHFENPWVLAANGSDHLYAFASNGKDTWYYNHKNRGQYIEGKNTLIKDAYFPEGLEWKPIELGTMRQFQLICKSI